MAPTNLKESDSTVTQLQTSCTSGKKHADKDKVATETKEVEKVALPAGILLTGAFVGHLVGKDSKFGALRGAVAGAILPLSAYALYKDKECTGVDCGIGNLLFAGSHFKP